MTKTNRHPLWNKDFPEAKDFFSDYYNETSNDIAEDEDELLSKFIEWDGKEHTKKTMDQLTELIESDMNDEELRNFIHEKLGSDFFAARGKSREWLQYICDYIKDHT